MLKRRGKLFQGLPLRYGEAMNLVELPNQRRNNCRHWPLKPTAALAALRLLTLEA
jgi:hypothetical protein